MKRTRAFLVSASLLAILIAGGIAGLSHRAKTPSTSSPEKISRSGNASPANASSKEVPPREEKQARFEELARSVQQQLPTLSELQGLSPSEVHETPPALVRAGAAMGKIAQAIHENPALAPAGLRFYRECASRDELPSSVRALCYADARGLSARIPGAGSLALDLPAEVRALAAKVPQGT